MTKCFDFSACGWSSAVDWATMTSALGAPPTTYTIARGLVYTLQEQFHALVAPRPMRALGYEGEGCAGLFAGRRFDGVLLRASGEAADTLVRMLHVKHWRFTRLDIALDVRTYGNIDGCILEMSRQAEIHRAASNWGFKRKIRRIDGCGDGDTMYIGSRSSSSLIRVYNKEKQSGDKRYAGVTRLELQLNGHVADDVGQRLAEGQYNVSVMGQTVAQALAREGVNVRLEGDDGEGLHWRVAKSSPDDDSTVKWLKTQVAPVVRRVANIYGERFVLDTLGLEGYNDVS